MTQAVVGHETTCFAAPTLQYLCQEPNPGKPLIEQLCEIEAEDESDFFENATSAGRMLGVFCAAGDTTDAGDPVKTAELCSPTKAAGPKPAACESQVII
jgi:hypothetical protein